MSKRSQSMQTTPNRKLPGKPVLIPALTVAILLLISLSSACSGLNIFPTPTPATPTPDVTAPTAAPSAPVTEITFRVEIPSNTPPGQAVSINFLDEVTGLALNSRSYPMQSEDERHYVLKISLPVGSVLKYRYTRQAPAAPVEEHLSDGRQVRYRLYYIQVPGEVSDVVSRWTDTEYSGPSGRIMGQVLDNRNGQPIPNLLVAAGGAQAFTSSDGSYLLEGLPPGIHNLVAYTLDGAYRTFQQGARVAENSTTPANLRLEMAPQVSLVFVVTVPEGTTPSVSIRLAGNLYQLGNSFANLTGGVSTLATRMPVLSVLPDGRYTLTLALPAGADIRYTYTMGDGFWNTELTPNGNFRVRQLIVPEANGVIEDQISTWIAKNSSPVTFEVAVPANTPAGDQVSIQFSPVFGWTEPIPMWPLGDNRWAYVLNSPQHLIGNVSYRFCRNNQCGTADDAQTAGPNHPGRPLDASQSSQTLAGSVDAWAWMSAPLGQTQFNMAEVSPRGPGFVAGIEFLPAHHPSWLPRLPGALDDVQNLRANWLVLTPTWTYTRSEPPVLEPVTGSDPLWYDLIDEAGQATSRVLRVAFFPTPRFPGTADEWWVSAPRDFPWWQSWFERYRSFLLHHADLAARTSAPALILGGDWLSPALPGGSLPDGEPSGVPIDAEARWRALLQEVRSRYSGSVWWALSSTQAVENPPAFLDSVDAIYVLFSDPLSAGQDPTVEELEDEAARRLDVEVLPIQRTFNKPVVIGIAYPSVNGGATACIQDAAGQCLEINALSPLYPDRPDFQVDLQEQVNIYSALLSAVNLRPWIVGFISRGYYPPAMLQDKSASIHGKPAQDVVSYWFPNLLAVPAP